MAKKHKSSPPPDQKGKGLKIAEEPLTEAEVEELFRKEKEDWTMCMQQDCSEELSKLSAKGCNEEQLLSLLWDVYQVNNAAWDASVLLGVTLEETRNLREQILGLAERIKRLNATFGRLFLVPHLLKLPKLLHQYHEATHLLTEKSELKAFLDSRGTPQFYRLAVCRLINYVYDQTERYYDKDLGKLVPAACGYDIDRDYREQHKKFRQRHYEKLKSYLWLLDLVNQRSHS